MSGKCDLLFIGVLAYIAVAGCARSQRRADTTPDTPVAVSMPDTFHDFGSLRAGETVSYNFRMVNTGQSELRIEKVETACGCVAVHCTDKPVQPGTTAFVEVTFNSSGEHGHVVQQIRLSLKAANRKEVSLTVAAQVENDLFINP
ncbi:MAG: DUF1573 domain-containing protein [Bacteroidales bacterium]|jgi:hypothetical protein|nr:DUF1573 domain-containing protein [Bacteroidales bacterium]